MSYYDFPQLSQWFPELPMGNNNQILMFGEPQYKWERKAFKKAAAAKKDGTQNEGIELLIMNY